MGWAERWTRAIFVVTLLVAVVASTSWIAVPLAGRGFSAAVRLAARVVPEAAALAPPAASNGSGATGAGGTPAGSDVAPGPASDTAPGAVVIPSAEGYVWPLSGAKITTYFAPNASGTMILDGVPIHNGLDLALPCGTPIGAAHSGRVIYAGRRADPYLGFSGSVQPYYDELARRKLTDRSLPIMVVIDDGNGLIAVYVHLGRADVIPGEAVSAGDVIGLEGRTGNATGCHLHYSLFLADGPWVPVAPILVAKWYYPAFMRLRLDPLLFLPLDSPDAGHPAPGLAPPADPPHYVVPPESNLSVPWD